MNAKRLNAKQCIEKVIETWFLSDPFLFDLYCTHQLRENRHLGIPFRSGNGLIEYSPTICDTLSQQQIKEYLKIEIYRISLRHPYQRQPANAIQELLYIASDITIDDICGSQVPIASTTDFKFSKNLTFEEYYKLLLAYNSQSDKIILDNKDSNQCINNAQDNQDSNQQDSNQNANNMQDKQGNQSNSKQYGNTDSNSRFLQMIQHAKMGAALWQENDAMDEIIKTIIEKALASEKYRGSVPRDFIEYLQASLAVKIDYRRSLSMFRHSILSNKRKLTRLKPSRRYGFKYMGSKYDFTTRLLVAVDTSGSVSNTELERFFSIINRFFKYGIESIEVIQFDAEISSEPMVLKKARKTIKILGRGGTDFQPVIDYYEKYRVYDGLIIFTDGEAPLPIVKNSRPKLWVFDGIQPYKKFSTQALPAGSKCTYIV